MNVRRHAGDADHVAIAIHLDGDTLIASVPVDAAARTGSRHRRSPPGSNR